MAFVQNHECKGPADVLVFCGKNRQCRPWGKKIRICNFVCFLELFLRQVLMENVLVVCRDDVVTGQVERRDVTGLIGRG